MIRTNTRILAGALVVAGFAGSFLSAPLLLSLVRDQLHLGCVYSATGEERGYSCGDGNGYFASILLLTIVFAIPIGTALVIVLRRSSVRWKVNALSGLSVVAPLILAAVILIAGSSRTGDAEAGQNVQLSVLLAPAIAVLIAVIALGVSVVPRAAGCRGRLLLVALGMFVITIATQPGLLVAVAPSFTMLLAGSLIWWRAYPTDRALAQPSLDRAAT